VHVIGKKEDWIFESSQFIPGSIPGTQVSIKLHNNCPYTPTQIFDQFTSGEDYGFTNTTVPVRLAQYGNEKLISRSQARRLLDRLDKFKIVLFDFDGVEELGQAFADEVFRVFKNQHPDISLFSINTNQHVARMISRAYAADSAEQKKNE
jgi:hypothetical protein